MARVSVQLTNFTAGELSPRLDGRNDLSKYPSGCKTLENFIVYPHGSAARRSGTQFISEVKTSANKTRLVPFEFSTTQTYILEFGNQYIRIYKDKGQVQNGGSAVEIATPYLTAELFDIKFAQSADVMYIVHPNHAARKLSRTSHINWTLTQIDFTKGPMQDPNTTTTTLNPGQTAVGTGVSLVASATTGINGGAGFASTDVGRFVFLHGGYAKITAFTDTTNVTIEILTTLSASTATENWRLGAFSDTTGHPSTVTFFEQRLVFAGTTEQPQTVFFSKSGDYENMDANIGGTIADSDAIIYTIASNQVNAIRFMTATRTLIIGTAGGEFSVSGGGSDVAITPTNILIKKQSNHGAANLDALAVGNVTLFMQRARRKMRELAYNFDVDGYIAPDMTILAEHITEGGITQMAYQQEPNQIIWLVRGDGELVGFTYQREQQVTAWHRHIFGGAFGSGKAVCESVAVIPTDDTEYEVYVIIKRTINGATKRYIEVLNTFDFTNTDNTTFNFLDSQLDYNGSATTTISGLSHLEGQTVSILADGSVHANKTVSSGSITLDRSVTKACVGLAYDSVLQTMRIEGGAAEGTSQGKTKRISKVVLRLFETVGVKVGPSLTQLETVPFRTTSSNLSAPVDTLLAGDKEIEFRDDYNSDGFIFIKQDQPLPCSVLAIYPTVVTSDG
mgnify:CR=1 FL=1